MTLKPNSTMVCPECGADQDGVASDFIIPGRTGKDSRAETECVECDYLFRAELMTDGNIKVE